MRDSTEPGEAFPAAERFYPAVGPTVSRQFCQRLAAAAGLALSEDVLAERRLSESTTKRREVYSKLTPYTHPQRRASPAQCYFSYAALRSRCGHYIFACGFFLLLFYTSPNLSGHRLDVYHTSTHGVALVRI